MRSQPSRPAIAGLPGRQAGRAGQRLEDDAHADSDEEHWDWRWLDGQVPKLFNVTFDRDGRVMHTAVADDMKAQQGSQ